MGIVLSDSKTFTPTPEGQHRIVCVDVVEQYGVETQWGVKNRIGLMYQTEMRMEDGKPYVLSAWFNATLNEKGRLRPFLESWRGRKFTADELKGFDLEKLIGANAIVQVVHNESGGKVYANIQAIMAPPKGVPALTPSEYVRVRDRKDDHPEPAKVAPKRDTSFDDFPEALEADDDDLPW